jgi:agmatine deiminase
VLEGGAVDVNGRGTILVTEECLLSPVQERNPGLGREGTEQALRDWLGVRHVVWLGDGIAGDDTHGHVDDLARFVDPSTVALAMADDPRDGTTRLKDNHDRLGRATDQDGRPLRVVRCRCRAALLRGCRAPATRTSRRQRGVLVPTFNNPADRRALHPRRALSDLGRRHPLRRPRAGPGTIHCMTQQSRRAPRAGERTARRAPPEPSYATRMRLSPSWADLLATTTRMRRRDDVGCVALRDRTVHQRRGDSVAIDKDAIAWATAR